MQPTIALYDSGVGGLHLLKTLINSYHARYIYYADTANMPYGTKSPEEIQQLTGTVLNQLLEYKPDCIIIACHTISSTVSPLCWQEIISCPVITMVELVTQQAQKATKNGRIGILGTEATIDSQAHQKSLLSLNPDLFCFPQRCRDLASVIERNPSDPELPLMIRDYLAPLKTAAIDTLILACTHYEAVRDLIAQEMGNGVTIIGASEYIASALYFLRAQENPKSRSNNELIFTITGDQNAFFDSTKIILGSNLVSKLSKER